MHRLQSFHRRIFHPRGWKQPIPPGRPYPFSLEKRHPVGDIVKDIIADRHEFHVDGLGCPGADITPGLCQFTVTKSGCFKQSMPVHPRALRQQGKNNLYRSISVLVGMQSSTWRTGATAGPRVSPSVFASRAPSGRFRKPVDTSLTDDSGYIPENVRASPAI
jgi:hypothetical protein